ncbi:DUF968 domain-containing protein [Enterobacter hormaechei]
MSAIITPFVQKETGVAVFSVDSATSNMIKSAERFLLTPLPKEQGKDTPDGFVDLNYSLVANETLKPFFESERVFDSLGGQPSVMDWVQRSVHTCQAENREDCDNQLTTHFHNGSAVRLCWYHDNEYLMRGYNRLNEVLQRNRANWIMSWANSEMRLEPGRDISLIELTFWALRRGFKDQLPQEAGRIALCKPVEEFTTGTMRESDIVWTYGVNELVEQLADKITEIDVDEESGLLYMARPKIQLGKSAAYRRFIVSRPCVGCSGEVNRPFMYRARGLNEHDRWCVPLCDKCAHDAAQDVRGWEAAHGKRLYVLANQIFDFAIEHGVINFNN